MEVFTLVFDVWSLPRSALLYRCGLVKRTYRVLARGWLAESWRKRQRKLECERVIRDGS